MKNSIFRIIALTFCCLLASCATNDDVERLENQIYRLEKQISAVNKGLFENQTQIKKDIGLLYSETEKQLASLTNSVSEIRTKTDKVDIYTDNGSVSITAASAEYNSNLSSVTLSKPGGLSDVDYWRNSGGPSKDAVGNRRYTLQVTAGGIASISLSSLEADTYLFLLDEMGQEIAENDDFDGNQRNSTIETRLKVGSYTVVAATYKKEISAAYTLTVSGIAGTMEFVE